MGGRGSPGLTTQSGWVCWTQLLPGSWAGCLGVQLQGQHFLLDGGLQGGELAGSSGPYLAEGPGPLLQEAAGNWGDSCRACLGADQPPWSWPQGHDLRE